jgi:hypothetical protein
MESSRRSWSAFLRLWLVLFFSYCTLKFAFNVGVAGYVVVDLRPLTYLELALLPFGQTIVLWLITRGRAAR